HLIERKNNSESSGCKRFAPPRGSPRPPSWDNSSPLSRIFPAGGNSKTIWLRHSFIFAVERCRCVCSQDHVESGQTTSRWALTGPGLSSNYNRYSCKTRRVLDEDEVPVCLRAGLMAFVSNLDSSRRLGRAPGCRTARRRSLPRDSGGEHRSQRENHRRLGEDRRGLARPGEY